MSGEFGGGAVIHANARGSDAYNADRLVATSHGDAGDPLSTGDKVATGVALGVAGASYGVIAALSGASVQAALNGIGTAALLRFGPGPVLGALKLADGLSGANGYAGEDAAVARGLRTGIGAARSPGTIAAATEALANNNGTGSCAAAAIKNAISGGMNGYGTRILQITDGKSTHMVAELTAGGQRFYLTYGQAFSSLENAMAQHPGPWRVTHSFSGTGEAIASLMQRGWSSVGPTIDPLFSSGWTH